MSKLLETFIEKAASTAAAAYCFTTKKGREVQEKTQDLYEEYKANPERYHQLAKDKVTDYKNLAVNTFKTYKAKFEQEDVAPGDIVATVPETDEEVPASEADDTTVVIDLKQDGE